MSSKLVEALLNARRSGARFAFGEGFGPLTVEAAYATQADVASALGAHIAGWKVGLVPGEAAFAAPILSCDMVADGGAFGLAPGAGPVLMEAELALRLGRDLPAGRTYTRDDILAATAQVIVGLEFVGSRYLDVDTAPFAAKLADNFNNSAYAPGGGQAAFGLDLASLRCCFLIDGVAMNDRIGGHPLGDPLIPVVAWANAQADKLGGLRAGQFITTGTLNVPVPLHRAAMLEAALDGVGEVRASIVV